jgi:hypothetical protein
MRRRTYIHGIATTALFGLVGCIDNNDSADDNGATGSSGETSSPSDTSTSDREVLVDETIYSRNRYPFDLQSGDRLVITIDVERGGPLVVDVADVEAGESLFSNRVETRETFEIDIQSIGPHYVTFQNVSEATIEVELVEATE